jgi:hypothetical protein
MRHRMMSAFEPAAPPVEEDTNTLFLMHADGLDGATDFADASIYARTISRGGAVEIDTAQSVFGGAAALFGGGHLTLPDSADLAFGLANFTIDCRVRFSSLLSALWSQATTGETEMRLQVAPDGSVRFQHYVGSPSPNIQLVTAAATVTTATWYHIALVRAGTAFTLFVDGVPAATAESAIPIANFAGPFAIGAEFVPAPPAAGTYTPLAGSIDEFRIRQGAAWTEAFTPPAAAYS